jgi:hypothetical protein
VQQQQQQLVMLLILAVAVQWVLWVTGHLDWTCLQLQQQL